ncbi:MAG: metallophosphoesterase [Pseudomonadota bacterium]
MITRRRFLKTLGGGAVISAALGSYAFAIEPVLRLKETHYRLNPPRWAEGPDLKIAVLADFHVCEPWMDLNRLRSVIERTQALGCDLILLLGDFSAGMSFATRHIRASEWAPLFSGLSAPLGVHAIHGNHDWWEDHSAQERMAGPTDVETALQNIGISVLRNEALRLEHNGKAFWLAGLESQIAFPPYRRFGRTEWAGLDDLPLTLSQITDDAPVLLMAHEPDIFPQIPDRVALTLSGHTHGGQVRLLGFSPVVPSSYGNRYAYGHVIENNRNLLVSGGLGCSIMPVRFGMPPEIVVLELTGNQP